MRLVRTALRSGASLFRSQARASSSATHYRTVGIDKMDIYFPKTCVSLADLEKADGVSEGKYTNGLGLRHMSFCNDREDINSICLTAVANFMESNNIDPKSIGRLEVGTETIVDKSKSVKTGLMQLFEESGNTDLEGIDNVNACYGGTAALLNSAAWVQSESWDGRNALVVCGDIAVYEPGPARPTGGAAVTVMLVKPDAALQLEPVRHSYFENAYDFYKPDLSSEYPAVDGKASIVCYLRALDSCYNGYIRRFADRYGQTFSHRSMAKNVLFHTPFVKMTNKAYARMLYNQFVNNPSEFPELAQFKDMSLEESYYSRDLEKALVKASAAEFQQQVDPTTLFAAEVGNSYTASLYASLVSALMKSNLSQDDRMLLFSYGSGLAATLFSLKVNSDPSSVINVQKVHDRLANRTVATPEEFLSALQSRESFSKVGIPQSSYEHFEPGTFYLAEVDEKKRRSYKRV